MMYYEEKVIDGITFCRNAPGGYWVPLSNRALTERIAMLNDSIKTRDMHIESLEASMQEHICGE